VYCHQHAVLGWDADEKLVAAAGAQAEHLETGCCGLAGNFGFQVGHGEVSEACAERALLPRLREAAPGAVVLADGFSCRTRSTDDGGGREAMHLAELLATAGGLDHDHPERTAAPRPAPPTPDGQGRRPGRNRRRPGRRRGDSGRRRRAGPLGAHPRRRSQGKLRRFIRKALPTVLVVGPAWQQY
jgi:hypothetical protein